MKHVKQIFEKIEENMEFLPIFEILDTIIKKKNELKYENIGFYYHAFFVSLIAFYLNNIIKSTKIDEPKIEMQKRYLNILNDDILKFIEDMNK